MASVLQTALRLDSFHKERSSERDQASGRRGELDMSNVPGYWRFDAFRK